MDYNDILLTHWDPGFYDSNSDPTYIADIALNALLYENVVIRAIDLVMNEDIARKLHSEDGLNLFQELIENDCVSILTTAPRDYKAPNLLELAEHAPITARAKDQLNRSFAGERWEPKQWQWNLCKKLDHIVNGYQACLRFTKPLPPENRFAVMLADVLRNRADYDLRSMPHFSDITDDVADNFIRCCEEPNYFKTILRKYPNPSTRDSFFRTEAYQCASVLGCTGIMNLAQSVYMGLECDREATAGRFGRKLWEPPFRFHSNEESIEAGQAVKRIELQPVARPLELALRPGLGKALRTTRGSSPFQELQRRLKNWDPALPCGDNLYSVVGSIAEIYAENASKIMVPYGSAERLAMHLVNLAFPTMDAFGLIGVLRTGDMLNLSPVAMHFAQNQCARLAGQMTNVVRSGIFYRSVSNEISSALTVRSSTVRIDGTTKGSQGTDRG